MTELNSFKKAQNDMPTIPARYNLKDRSEMVHEIISRKPNFMEKWALLVFGGILLSLFASLWFIKYPDIIEVRAILTSENAPREILSRQNGRVVKFFFQNNDSVNKDEILGWIESTADHSQVLKLSKQLDTSLVLLNAGLLKRASMAFDEICTNLGAIQTTYQNFNVALNAFKDYLVNGYYYRKKSMLEKDIQSLQKTLKAVQQQRSLIEQDMELARQANETNKSLYEQNTLSKEEYREAKSRYVNKQLELPRNEASIFSTETAINAIMKEIQQLDHDVLQQKEVYHQAVETLKSAVNEWVRKYIITAPVEGRLTLVMPLQENQLLAEGTTIGFVSGADSRMYMQTNLPQYNFGKIQQGLNVQLRFDAYPYHEVGFVEGTLQHISDIPTDSGFLATISLKKGLITNNNKRLFFKSGLKAQAVIITKNLTLLERLWYSITKSVSVEK